MNEECHLHALSQCPTLHRIGLDGLVAGSGCLGTLGTVLATGSLAVLDTLEVERAAHDVVTHTGQVLHTTAANEHDRVFLQVVAFTTDVRNDFVAVGETHLGDLTQSGVRLLGGGGVHTCADTTTL